MDAWGKRRWDYDVLAATVPLTRAWLEPRRFVVPAKASDTYGFPGGGVITTLGRFIAALDRFREHVADRATFVDSVESDVFFLCVLHSLFQNNTPTFFLGEDIGSALLETEAPEETSLADIRFPYQCFRVFLPKGMFFLNGREVAFLTIGLLNGNMGFDLDRRVIDELRRHRPQISQPPTFKGTIGFKCSLFFVMAGMVEGDPMEIVVPWEQSKLGTLVTNFRNLEKTQPVQGKNGESMVDGVRLLHFAVNLVMLLSWVPDEVTDGKCVRKAQTDRKGEITKTELWEPSFIGRPTFKKTYPAKPGGGEGPDRFDEVRKAHWKRQAHGPAYSLRKVIWVSLYRTRSREDRCLPPET